MIQIYTFDEIIQGLLERIKKNMELICKDIQIGKLLVKDKETFTSFQIKEVIMNEKFQFAENLQNMIKNLEPDSFYILNFLQREVYSKVEKPKTNEKPSINMIKGLDL